MRLRPFFLWAAWFFCMVVVERNGKDKFFFSCILNQEVSGETSAERGLKIGVREAWTHRLQFFFFFIILIMSSNGFVGI